MVVLAEAYVALGKEAELVLTDRNAAFLKFADLPKLMSKDLKMSYVLAQLTEESGFPPQARELLDTVLGLYRRVEITTGNGLAAWAYEYGEGLDLTLIPSGDWFAR